MKTRPAASLAKGPAFLAGTEVTYGSQASRPGSHLGALHPYTCGGDSALVMWPSAPYQAKGGEVSASKDFRAPGTTTFVHLYSRSPLDLRLILFSPAPTISRTPTPNVQR